VAEFARDETLDVADVLKMDQTVDADEWDNGTEML